MKRECAADGTPIGRLGGRRAWRLVVALVKGVLTRKTPVEDGAVKAGGAALTDWMVAAGGMQVEIGMVSTGKAVVSSSPAQHGPPQSPRVLREERLDERDRALSSRSWAFTASSMAAAIDIFTSKYSGCP